jgi:tRNA pseudouridine55 synthase
VSPAESGLAVLDKPGGPTSHDIVVRVRRTLGTRRVGHAGTLDPMATGVLVLGVNRATRLLGHLTLAEKSYDATIRLGAATSTDDAEGEVLAEAPTAGIDPLAVREGLAAFAGEIDQVPATVSAVKVSGMPAHRRVRLGEQVDLAARRVTVHELVVHEVALPDVRISIRCSSGTYVRAIARDLGTRLGVGGHLASLRRTSSGPFSLDRAQSLDRFESAPTLIPMADVARRSFPVVELTVDQAVDVRFGRTLELRLPASGPVAVFAPTGEFLALYHHTGADHTCARALAVFA